MKNMKDYESSKKEFIKLQDLNSDNIYTYFSNDDMLLLIRRYYEIYTKFLFNQLMGSLRLEVSSQKAEKLMNLKGVGSWEFAGMIDVYERGKETCELGHPLRYVYKARNVDNGEIKSVKAIVIKFISADRYKIETYDFPITIYSLEHMKKLEQTNSRKTSEPKFPRLLNRTIDKDEIKKAKRLVLERKK